MEENTAYCMHCRKKVIALNLQKGKQNSRNKMWMYKGTCPDCKGVVCKLKKE